MSACIERSFIIECPLYGDMEEMARGKLVYSRRNFQDSPNLVVIDTDTGSVVLRLRQSITPQWNHRFSALTVRAGEIDLFALIMRHMKCIEVDGDLNLYKMQFLYLNCKLNGGRLELFDPNYYGVEYD